MSRTYTQITRLLLSLTFVFCICKGVDASTRSTRCQQIRNVLKLAQKHRLRIGNLVYLQKRYCNRRYPIRPRFLPCTHRLMRFYRRRGVSALMSYKRAKRYCRTKRSPRCLIRAFRVLKMRGIRTFEALYTAENTCSQSPASQGNCVQRAYRVFYRGQTSTLATKSAMRFCMKKGSVTCLQRVYPVFHKGQTASQATKSAATYCSRLGSWSCLKQAYTVFYKGRTALQATKSAATYCLALGSTKCLKDAYPVFHKGQTALQATKNSARFCLGLGSVACLKGAYKIYHRGQTAFNALNSAQRHCAQRSIPIR